MIYDNEEIKKIIYVLYIHTFLQTLKMNRFFGYLNPVYMSIHKYIYLINIRFILYKMYNIYNIYNYLHRINHFHFFYSIPLSNYLYF